MDGGGGRDFRVLGLVENIDEGVAILWIATSFFMRALLDALPFGSRQNEKKKDPRLFGARVLVCADLARRGLGVASGTPEDLPSARLAQLGAGGRELGQHPCEPLGHTGHGGSPDGGAFTRTGHETTPFVKR